MGRINVPAGIARPLTGRRRTDRDAAVPTAPRAHAWARSAQSLHRNSSKTESWQPAIPEGNDVIAAAYRASIETGIRKPGVTKIAFILKSGGYMGGAYITETLKWIKQNTGLDIADENVIVIGQSIGTVPTAYVTQANYNIEDVSRVFQRTYHEDPTLGEFLEPGHHWLRDLGIRKMKLREVPVIALGAALEGVVNFSEKHGHLRSDPRLTKLMRGGLLVSKKWSEDLQRLPKQWQRHNVVALARDWANNKRVVLGSPELKFPEYADVVYEATQTPAEAFEPSFLIPGALAPAEVNGRILRDGTDEPDIDVAVAMGATHIIEIDPMIKQHRQRSKHPLREALLGLQPSVVQDARHDRAINAVARAREFGIETALVFPDAPGVGYFTDLMKMNWARAEQCALVSLRHLRDDLQRVVGPLGIHVPEPPFWGTLAKRHMAGAQNAFVENASMSLDFGGLTIQSV